MTNGARRILLDSGRRRHDERFPLDGSKELPTESIDMSSSIEEGDEMPPTKKRNSDVADKIVAFLTPAAGWVAPRTIAHEFGLTSENTSYHLKKLLAKKRVQAKGTRMTRAYGSIELQAPDAKASGGKKRKRKARRARAAAAPPAAAPAPASTPSDFTISNTGDLTITGGVHLNAPAVRRLHKFLETTIALWDDGAQ